MLVSGKMSGLKYSLGDLLKLWKSSTDLHFLNKETGDKLSLIQITMGLSFTKIQVFNRSKNLIETFNQPLKNFEPEFNPAKALGYFRDIHNFDLRELDLGYLLIEKFLEKVMHNS